MTSSCVNHRCKVVSVIFGGFLIHLALGAAYTIGNFSPYIISYLRNRTDDTSVQNVDVLWLSGMGSAGNCLGLIIGGLNAYRFGDRIAIFIGSIVFCGSTALNYFSVQKSYIAWITTQGLVGYLGHKLTYGTPIQTAIRWLPNHATLAAGLIVSGTGGGSLVFNQLITEYVNPDNLSPDYIDDDGERYFTQADVLDKVPTCFVILGGVYFGLQMIGLSLISEPPPKTEGENKVDKSRVKKNDFINDVQLVKITEIDPGKRDDIGHYNKGFETSEEKVKEISDFSAKTDVNKMEKIPQDNEDNITEELTILQAIKSSLTSRSFYIIWFTILLINIGMQFFTGLYKAYGQTFIEDDHFLALVGSIAAVFNCAGRPVWGAVMDKAGFRVAIRCVSCGFAVFSGTMLLTEHFPKGLFLVWICAIYFFFSGIWSLMPSALAKMLGPQHMAINYGLIYTGMAVAYIIGSTVGTSLKATIGWHGLFYIAAGLAAIVFFQSFLFNGVDRSGKRI
ncbi:hypothetical protein ACF0H5_020788 [Mactra antiquata]